MEYELITSGGSFDGNSPYDNLDEEQLLAVKSEPGPLLVIAGAGTGKTRTLVSRVGHLLLSGVPPERIMLCTFTIKAANEMVDRLSMMAGQSVEQLWAGTFHHIGNRILRIFGEKIGIGKDFTVLDSEDSSEFLHGVMHDLGAASPLTAQKLGNLFSYAVSTQSSMEEVIDIREPDFRELKPKIVEIFEVYTERKILQQVVDFDDLLLLWKVGLTRDPLIRDEITGLFDHILVDEYQDTNKLQGDIITAMAAKHRNITVVGDDAQAIYSFRGATPHNIWSFLENFPEGRVYKLENNYRSTSTILQLANEVILKAVSPYPKRLRSNSEAGSPPVFIQVRDEYQQSQFICQRLWELHMEEGIPLSEIAILYRTHKQAVEIEMELTRRKIPFVINGGLRLFEQAHFKDIISYLRILHNPLDEIALMRFFRLIPSLGTSTARKLLEVSSELDPSKIPPDKHLYSFVIPSEPQLYSNKALRTEVEFLQSLIPGKLNLKSLMETILAHYTPIGSRKFNNWEHRLEELNNLIELSSQYPTFDQLITDLGLNAGAIGEVLSTNPEEPEDKVTLSTVHQAKGLEWKVVFLAGVTEGLFPLSFASKSASALDEERRLFHVALTRASEYLYMIHPGLNKSDRRRQVRRASRFISEIPPALYDSWTIKPVKGS
ncbi:MAG: ATP-dependent helicase [Deltaproteobacteria bacterium]|nr:ATP-dependent helicase [Deltaproteobacteria bacterium]